MVKRLWRWLDVYEDEIGLFLWTTLLLVMVRGSGMILNNYAETAFLKRYGVEFLPIVNMITAGVTFVVMGAVVGISSRFSASHMLAGQFLFCGASVAAIRIGIPLGLPLLYPSLFVLKALYEVLLAMFFWNLANDLYNVRQSKRLFPLMTAGGVVGLIAASFGTAPLARVVGMDNLLLVYLVLALAGAVAVKGMGHAYPSRLLAQTGDPKGVPKDKAHTSLAAEIKAIYPLLKSSPLFQGLVLLTFLPNVLIPIMNYQFNFAVDTQFASESRLIWFFGTFRGVMNIISLFLLLFVSRLYGRFGLTVALMFHPFNYALVFASFLLRFDLVTAIYARMSSNVIRTTINIPAMAVLTGMVSPAHRNLARPFLRGTVVRIALVLGSGAILVSEPLFHPRYLSIVAFPFVAAWIDASFVLKRRYAGILLQSIAEGTPELHTAAPDQIAQAFKDPRSREELRQALLTTRGPDRLWHANLLQTLGDVELDRTLLEAARGEADDGTRARLIEMLSDAAGEPAARQLEALADPRFPRATAAVLETTERLAPGCCDDLHERIFASADTLTVRGLAAAALLRRQPERYRPVIDGWLAAAEPDQQEAGIVAAGHSQLADYVPVLTERIRSAGCPEAVALALEGLHQLDPARAGGLALEYLAHRSDAVRLAALEAVEITDGPTLERVIPLLGDASETLRERAQEKIGDAPYHDSHALLAALDLPNPRVRDGVLSLLETMRVSALDLGRFVRGRVRTAYERMAEADALSLFDPCAERDLLEDHLQRQSTDAVRTALRVLSTQDPSGQLVTLTRGLFSADDRTRANGAEALGEMLSRKLARVLTPLFEGSTRAHRLEVGRRRFRLPTFPGGRHDVLNHLLAREDWVTQALVLYLAARDPQNLVSPATLVRLCDAPNPQVRAIACRIRTETPQPLPREESTMTPMFTLPEKILHLREVELFSGLEVGELAAVAAVTEEKAYEPGELVFRSGEPGDAMYFIAAGEVVAVREEGDRSEVELERLGPGKSFGEAVLFEDLPRSATVRVESRCRLLAIRKREIEEAVREFPDIALHACKVLSERVRALESKASGPWYCRI